MKIEISKISEPKLEFAGGFTHPYIREALLTRCGPYDSNFYSNCKNINLGLVTLPDQTDDIVDWVDSMQSTILTDESNVLKYPEFLGTEEILKCKFKIDVRQIKIIDPKKYEEAIQISVYDRFRILLEMYADQIKSLFSDNSPDCILVYFPEEVASLRIANQALSTQEISYLEYLQKEDEAVQTELFELTPEQKALAEDLLPQAEELLFRNFHRALKAKCMNLPNSVPIQIIRDHTFKPDTSSQSKSTIAWNVCTALYYKSKSIPWRLHDISSDICFVGITFHHLKKRSGDIVYASIAQAFSSTGEGFVLKGSMIHKDQKRNKRPYLLEVQAQELINMVLEEYILKSGDLPSKVVIHKTSKYEPEEIAGFKNILVNTVPRHELVWFSPSAFRLLRRGTEPPERGTICTLDGREHFVFTTGYVKSWREYPGPHIPSPLEIGAVDEIDFFQTANEILALTKMNWNTTDGIGRYPITLSFARRVGMIMTELPEDVLPNPSYRFYM